MRPLYVCAVLCLAAGCSSQSTGTVQGKVIFDGAPLGGFEVAFFSAADGSAALGSAMADGTYRLVKGRSGSAQIPVGKYKVTVTPTAFIDGVPMPKVKMRRAYTDPATTDLTFTVEPGENVIDINLTSGP